MSNMTKAELEAKLRQAQNKICYCECKNKELQERLSAIVAPVQCDTYAEAVRAYGQAIAACDGYGGNVRADQGAVEESSRRG